MRTAILLLCLVPIRASDPDLPGFHLRLERFHGPYNRWMRTFLGCPEGARTAEECDPRKGTFDYREFNRARRAAKDLFGE